MFTLCSLVYNNLDYLLYQEKICRKLAGKDYKRLIIDASPEPVDFSALNLDNQSLQVIDGKWINKYSGSTAHGVAVNEMIRHIGTKYAIILDLDIVPLVKNWDLAMLNALENGLDAIGVPYNPLHKRRRIQNMPTVFFFAFNVRKIQNAKLNWGTLPTHTRLLIYKCYRMLNKLRGITGTPKYFDFEMSQFAIFKMILKGLRTEAFKMVQPWDEKSKLKFDISYLPADKKLIDPLEHSYPEEWHYKGIPFVTHQRRSYAKSFNQTEYSKNWVKTVNNYLGL